MAYTIWPNRAHEVCKKDRSIAIAHGVGDLWESHNLEGETKKRGGSEMNLPEPQGLPFSSLISDIEKGNIKIPQFQRNFVWNKEKSAKLLDSIVKAYPIGTLIFWKTKEELRSIRNLGGIELPPTPEGDFINYVLDGQQRLTSLFASLKGLKIVREDYEEDYSEFYVDLEAKEDEPIVITELADTDDHHRIKLNDLLYIHQVICILLYPKCNFLHIFF